MRIAITGATGFIGARLVQHLQTSHEIFVLHRNRKDRFLSFDLSQPAALRTSLESLNVDILIHAGGIARRRLCELDPTLAYVVNVDATRVISEWCAMRGVRLLFFSSVGLYESNVYASTKRLAERSVEEAGVKGSTLRLAYTFGVSPSKSRPKPQMRLENEARERGSQIFDRSWKFQPTSLDHVCKVVEAFLYRNDTFPRKASIVTTEETTMHALASACSEYDVRSSLDYQERIVRFIRTYDLLAAQLPTCSLVELYKEVRILVLRSR